MSKRFNMVKNFYDSGRWNQEMVKNAIGRWITEEEYNQIVGVTDAGNGNDQNAETSESE